VDLVYAWASSGTWQKVCFLFLCAVVIIAVVRTVRLACWHLRLARDVTGPARDAEALTAWRRGLFARSTRGLAEASFAFTCAGAAAGLLSSSNYLGNSTRSGIATLAEQSLHALDVSGVAWVLCALLFFAAWAMDRGTPDLSARDPALDAMTHGRGLLWPLAMLLTAVAVFELRVTYDARLAIAGDSRAASAVFEAVGRFWSRLELLFGIVGGLTWLGVLAESAVARRAGPV